MVIFNSMHSDSCRTFVGNKIAYIDYFGLQVKFKLSFFVKQSYNSYFTVDAPILIGS